MNAARHDFPFALRLFTAASRGRNTDAAVIAPKMLSMMVRQFDSLRGAGCAARGAISRDALREAAMKMRRAPLPDIFYKASSAAISPAS